MAKLSREMLDEGREFVRTQDLDGLIDWIKGSRVTIDLDVVRKTFSQCFRAGDARKAVLIFDAAFTEADPTVDRIVAWGKIAVALFVILGLLGGVLSLFRGW